MVPRVGLLLILLIAAGFVGQALGSRPLPAQLLSPLSQSVLGSESRVPLAELLNNFLTNSRDQYGIYIKNLSTQETFAYHEHDPFPALSLYKLWVLGEAVSQIQSGRMASSSAINQYLNSMITISDNSSAELMIEKIGLSAYLDKYDFVSSDVDAKWYTTAADIGFFFDLLYQGRLADPSHTAYMLNMLKNQQLNHKLPKYLPPGTVVAHKTGDLNLYSHDAGIVYSPRGNYIIVVLCQSNYPGLVPDQIAKLSQKVYHYFNPE